MNLKWQSISNKVAELSLRERLMILSASLVILYYPAYSLLLSHWWHDTHVTNMRLTTNKKQIATTQELIETIQIELQKDPNKVIQKQRMDLLQTLKDKDTEFREKAAELVSPELMANLLKRVLNSSRHLKLIELASVEPRILLTLGAEHSEAEEQSTQASLFAHGVKLKLIGNYFNILNFLQSLEQLPEQFYWQALKYEVVTYPNANLEIEIYTLSTQEEFIGG